MTTAEDTQAKLEANKALVHSYFEIAFNGHQPDRAAMVLELHTPHRTAWAAPREDLPVLLAYVLSFVYIAIYWNNHHNMLAAVSRVSGVALWATGHLIVR